MRAVIKLKKDADAKAILAYLYKNTELETTFGINIVAIANGKPCQLGLLDIISYYVNYQREVVLRRTKFDLERAKERAEERLAQKGDGLDVVRANIALKKAICRLEALK